MHEVMGSEKWPSLLVKDLERKRKAERMEIQRCGVKVYGKAYENEGIKCEDLCIRHLCLPGNMYHGRELKQPSKQNDLAYFCHWPCKTMDF